MSNHCIDVVCCLCGHSWCLRGCGYTFFFTPEQLQGIIPRKKNVKVTASCPHCGDDTYIVII